MPSPPAELKFKVMPLSYCDLYVAYKQANYGNQHIPKGTIDLLFDLGTELGVHTAIKAICGYESAYGVALICRLLGIGNTNGICFRSHHEEQAILHLQKLRLIE